MHLLCKQDHVGALPIVSTSLGPVFARTRALFFGDTNSPSLSNDGLPDAWEIRHQLNPLDPTDATRDEDRDGFVRST